MKKLITLAILFVALTATQAFADDQDIGHDRLVFTGEHAPGSPEPGCNFIQNQQHVKPVTQFAHSLEKISGIKVHASGALHNRLHDNRGNCVLILDKQVFKNR